MERCYLVLKVLFHRSGNGHVPTGQSDWEIRILRLHTANLTLAPRALPHLTWPNSRFDCTCRRRKGEPHFADNEHVEKVSALVLPQDGAAGLESYYPGVSGKCLDIGL